MSQTTTQHTEIDDVNIEKIIPLITPSSLKAELPLSDTAYQTVLNGRKVVQNILDGVDKRILVVVGPCSIHDPVAAHAYADDCRYDQAGYQPTASFAAVQLVRGGLHRAGCVRAGNA